MVPEHDLIRLRHMLEEARLAREFVAGRALADLRTDALLAHGVVRAIEATGEAAGQVSPAAREALPQIPWGIIFGMRNRLIHAYHSVDPEIVWQTVTEDLPALVAVLEPIVEGAGPPDALGVHPR